MLHLSNVCASSAYIHRSSTGREHMVWNASTCVPLHACRCSAGSPNMAWGEVRFEPRREISNAMKSPHAGMSISVRGTYEHYPRDPEPEIRTREATGDNAFHTCLSCLLLCVKKKQSLGLGLFHSAERRITMKSAGRKQAQTSTAVPCPYPRLEAPNFALPSRTWTRAEICDVARSLRRGLLSPAIPGGTGIRVLRQIRMVRNWSIWIRTKESRRI